MQPTVETLAQDPAWNPSVDSQSVDRAYRIGQARDVVVYRRAAPAAHQSVCFHACSRGTPSVAATEELRSASQQAGHAGCIRQSLPAVLQRFHTPAPWARLITCGTVEEKIYRKQVFKGGLSRTGTEDGVQFRYFSQLARPSHLEGRRAVCQSPALSTGALALWVATASQPCSTAP